MKTADVLLERVPPQDLDAEVAVLGSVLINNSVIGEVLEVLGPDAPQLFYKRAHRTICEAILRLHINNTPCDLITLKSELGRLGELESCGGDEYLAGLVASIPSAANAPHYAASVRDKAIVRNLIETATAIIREAEGNASTADELMGRAQALIFESGKKWERAQIVTLGKILHDTFRQISEIRSRSSRILGLPSGLHAVDDALSGFQPAQSYIIAGRPSMGKTSLAMRVAEHVALDQEKPVLFFSLEMAKGQIAQSMLCAHSRVDSHKLRTGFLSEEEYQRLILGAGRLNEAKLYIDDSADLAVLELRNRARRMAKEQGIQLVIVDYLQKMHANLGPRESREREISFISSQMKSMAKELNVPVIALAQLNRAAEGREDRKPQLSDLRESGSLEQDADVVMLLYRDDYYNPDTERKNICEVIVAKNRTGPTMAVELAFIKQFTRFENLAQTQG